MWVATSHSYDFSIHYTSPVSPAHRRTLMPIIEVNQVRYVCASIRLDKVTAARVDQYAEFIHASAEARNRRSTATIVHLFTELLGIQLINTPEPLIRGERMTADHLNAILGKCDPRRRKKSRGSCSRVYTSACFGRRPPPD
jgi:hypothetical protein